VPAGSARLQDGTVRPAEERGTFNDLGPGWPVAGYIPTLAISVDDQPCW